MTQILIGRQYTLKKAKLQNNRTEHNPHFQKIVELLNQDKISKRKIYNSVRSYASSRSGQLFVRLIRNLNLHNESYDTIAKATGVTKEQARGWIEEWDNELFIAKSRKAGDNRA